MSYELVVYLYYAYACRVTENKIKNKEDIGRTGDHHFRRWNLQYSDAGEAKTEKPHGRA